MTQQDQLPPLYPFQAAGIDWMLQSIEHRQHAVSHDEQGLGKSRQALAVADAVNAQRVLILCQPIGRLSWEEQMIWQTIERPLLVITGTRDVHKLTHYGNGPLLCVCSFDGPGRSDTILRMLRMFPWDLFIGDEVQQLRVPDTLRTQASYNKQFGIMERIPLGIIMTGTPVVSWPRDLWTHLARWEPHRIQVNGSRLTYDQFIARFHVTREINVNGTWITKIVNAINQAELKERMNGYAIRRLKRDVLSELPPMNFRPWNIGIIPADRKLMMERLRHELPPRLARALDDAKTDAQMLAVVQDIASSSAAIATTVRLTGEAKAPSIVRALKAELEESTYKIGVFAWNTSVIETLMQGLKDFAPVCIQGGTGDEMREQAVIRFMTDPSCRVFVGQIAACGTAITLTSASRVVFAQQSWTPGENAQAAARFHRIGQRNAVDVRAAILPGTIDSALQRTLLSKTEAATVIEE